MCYKGMNSEWLLITQVIPIRITTGQHGLKGIMSIGPDINTLLELLHELLLAFIKLIEVIQSELLHGHLP